jgi:hypothetical protein
VATDPADPKSAPAFAWALEDIARRRMSRDGDVTQLSKSEQALAVQREVEAIRLHVEEHGLFEGVEAYVNAAVAEGVVSSEVAAKYDWHALLIEWIAQRLSHD